MKPSQYDNAANAWVASEKAMQKAKERLKAEGVNYPMWDSKKSTIENADAINSYSELEAKYYLEALAPKPDPRPLVLDNVSPNKHWGQSYYDK